MADTFLTEAHLKERERHQDSFDRTQDSARGVKFNTQRSPAPAFEPKDQPSYREKIEKMRERNWEKILEKISFKPPYREYYQDNEYAIRPGFYFYKTICESDYPIENLKVNIPETYVALDKNYWISNTDGQLSKIEDPTFLDFQASLEKQTALIYEKRNDLPFAIQRSASGDDWLCNKYVYTLKMLKDNRKYNIDMNTLIQRYIFPKGFVATVFRFCYFTKNSKDKKASFGYRIKNHVSIFDTSTKISLINKTTINTEKNNSFDINLVTGDGLKQYIDPSKRLVYFLERAQNVRVTNIVIDYMTDFQGQTWLINVRSIQLENVMPIQITLEETEEEGKKTLDQLTCSVYCKLCGLIFKKDDASKTLTYKLLWELIQHLKKRGIFLKGIVVSNNSTRACRVCDLCYMLAVSEHELIEAEQKFARAQNIPIEEALVRVPIDQKPKMRPALLAEGLHQWRLLIFAHSITGLELDNAYFDPKNIQLQFKFYGQKTSFKLHHVPSYDETRGEFGGFGSTGFTSATTLSNKQQKIKKMMDSRGEITFPKKKKASGLYMINAMRIHYLFSETEDIPKFLEDTEIEMRLVRGDDWNNYFAIGKTQTINQFKRRVTTGQTHQSQTFCFFENGRFCNVKFLFGLVCDDIVNTGSMNLYKKNNVYLPDEDFYNTNPFPIEWMEIFEKKDILMNELFEEEHQEKIYSPKCSPNDISKMVDLPGHRHRKEFSTVDSVVKRSWSAKHLNATSKIGEKSEFQSFKFTTLTENPSNKTLQPSNSKPARIFSADIRKRTLPPTARDPYKTIDSQRTDKNGGQRPATGLPKERKVQTATAPKSSDPIDQEIEVLRFLNRNAQQKDRDQKIGRTKGSYLQNFDQQFKHLEDDEIVKMYLGKEDTYETGDSVEYLHREDQQQQQQQQKENIQIQEDPRENEEHQYKEQKKQEKQPEDSDRKPKMSHNELTRLIQQRQQQLDAEVGADSDGE